MDNLTTCNQISMEYGPWVPATSNISPHIVPKYVFSSFVLRVVHKWFVMFVFKMLVKFFDVNIVKVFMHKLCHGIEIQLGFMLTQILFTIVS